MPDINIYKNPPPKIRLGQDLDGSHWSMGQWIWQPGEQWEWNEAEQVWDYTEGYWNWEKGDYWIFVISSNVSAIRYDIETQQLYVRFDSGRIYEYQEIEEDIALGMFHSESMGEYVHHILIARGFTAIRLR